VDQELRIQKILRKLKKLYPDAHCSLYFESPFQLLVATVLSAQCTDERVNKVVPGLFKKFPTPFAMSKASHKEIEKLIHSTGFYKNKAKSILSLSNALVEEYEGEVPKTLDQLHALRGVGRKTANVVLGNAFGVPGLVVDTHVGRLVRRFGFTKLTDPEKVEQAMMKLVPKNDWVIFSHLLIAHGRAVCQARSPHCEVCGLSAECKKVGVKKA